MRLKSNDIYKVDCPSLSYLMLVYPHLEQRQEYLKDRRSAHLERFKTVIKIVSEVTGISQQAIIGHSRKREIIEARHITIALTRNTWENQSDAISLAVLGKYVGNRDHSTMIHAETSIANLYGRSDIITNYVNECTQLLMFQNIHFNVKKFVAIIGMRSKNNKKYLRYTE